MKFDTVLTNPPFQDTVNRGKTPHKLWIDFTRYVFDNLLADGGVLCQVSPSSFQSPSNKILNLMKDHRTTFMCLDTGEYFPQVGSTFADYSIVKVPNDGSATEVVVGGVESLIHLNQSVFYLPKNLCEEALSVHQKVIFSDGPKLAVEKDYVTCHNILLRRSDTLSKETTERHVYPVFHTNRQTWWSSIRQPWADSLKVMWTRSGYTQPFFDPGRLGGTDMVYYVVVGSEVAGEHLSNNMNLRLMRYIYATARWSGFGNEKVFAALPSLPLDRSWSDEEMYAAFSLTPEEVAHVERVVD